MSDGKVTIELVLQITTAEPDDIFPTDLAPDPGDEVVVVSQTIVRGIP